MEGATEGLSLADWYKHPMIDDIRVEISRLELQILAITSESVSVEAWWTALRDVPRMLSAAKGLLTTRRQAWIAQGLLRGELVKLDRLMENALDRIPDVAVAVLTEWGYQQVEMESGNPAAVAEEGAVVEPELPTLSASGENAVWFNIASESSSCLKLLHHTTKTTKLLIWN